MRLFFFGSLMDLELLALVIGRPVDGLSTAEAVLHGFERRRAVGESFPIIVPHPGGWVDGLLVDGLTAADLDRIQFFEGSDYALHPFTVEWSEERIDVQVFLPTARLAAEPSAWDFAAWAESERGDVFCPGRGADVALWRPQHRRDRRPVAGDEGEGGAAFPPAAGNTAARLIRGRP